MKTHDDRLLPPRWVLVLIASALLIWLLYYLKEIVVFLVLGYSIAYIIDPLVSRLERRGLPRSIGVIGVLILFAAAILLLLVTAIPTIIEQFQNLSANFPQYIETSKSKLEPLLSRFSEYIPVELQSVVNGGSAAPLLSHIDGSMVQRLFGVIAAALLQGYSLTLTLLNLFLLPFIVYYISVDFKIFHQNILELVPVIKRKRIVDIAVEMDRYVSAFVRGQLIICAVLFLLYLIGLKIVGIELWFLVSVISGFGNMVPYVGTLTGVVLASIMALVTFGEVGPLFSVWIVFAVVQFLEGTFITPSVMGKNVGMSPLMVILSILVGGTLFGLLGIFLAIPAAAVLKVLLRHLHVNLSRSYT